MTHYTKAKVITIDGPSGVGKGTASRILASYLGWDFLDSGALYRLCALEAQRNTIELDDILRLVSIANNLNIRFSCDTTEDNPDIWLNDKLVNDDIRTETCGKAASQLAAIPAIREALLQRQRNFLTDKGLVADGRDMGTVVFTESPLKFFLTASAKIRAKRRQLQLKQLGKKTNFEQLLIEIKQRDERDQKRAISPLKPAENAILLDTTDLSIQKVSDRMLMEANKIFA